MSKPFLSVCVPNYNHGNILAETINSALEQDCDDYEILISDNASNDNSAEVLKQFENHSKVKVLHQPSTIPMSEHWNIFKDYAQGKWVLVLSSDDVLYPHAITSLKKITEQHKKSEAVFFEYNFLKLGKRVEKTKFYQSSAVIPAKKQFEIFLKGNNFPLTGAICKREKLNEIGWFNEKLVFCSDWYEWLLICKNVDYVTYYDQALFDYRHHEKNETSQCIENLSAIDEVMGMKDNFIKEEDISDPGILNFSMLNSKKIATLYQKMMIENNKHDIAKSYQDIIINIDEILNNMNFKSDSTYISAPYPLPDGAVSINTPL